MSANINIHVHVYVVYVYFKLLVPLNQQMLLFKSDFLNLPTVRAVISITALAKNPVSVCLQKKKVGFQRSYRSSVEFFGFFFFCSYSVLGTLSCLALLAACCISSGIISYRENMPANFFFDT